MLRYGSRVPVLSPARIAGFAAAVLALSACCATAARAEGETEGLVTALQLPPPGPLTPSDTLLNQALYWASRDPHQAESSLERLLRLDRADSSALAILGTVEASLGRSEVAAALLRRLRAAVPGGDPRIAQVELAIHNGPIDSTALEKARGLAAGGHPHEAVDAYQQAFHGDKPPDIYAAEYYLVLQTVEGKLEEALQGLSASVARLPHNTELGFVYAKIMSYAEAHRADAIDMLASLAGFPGLADAARQAWREALLWQGPDYRAQAQLETYLQRYPDDHGPDLDAKRDEQRRSLPDDGARERWGGYQALEAKNPGDAERHFAAALAFNPHDPDALIAMAIVRLQQGRKAEAHRLADEASAIAPDRRDEFQKAITPGGGGGVSAAAANAAIRRSFERIRQLTDQGDFAAAEALLRRSAAKKPGAGYYVQLGSIQSRAGHAQEAETSFRQALQLRPGDPDALHGLAHLQVNRLRAEADAATDPAAKERSLRAAVAADSSDPWAKLALARLLADRHHIASADAVMADVAAGSQPSQDQLQAALLWANSRNDLRRAARLLAQVPDKGRTPAVQEISQRIVVRDDVSRALAAPTAAEQRERLLALAARSDPTGERAAAVADAFFGIGDRGGAREAINAALRATPEPTSAQRLLYVPKLVQAGDDDAARRLANEIDPQRLAAPLRASYRGVMDGLAINRADRLNQEGRQADAYDVLAPHLQADSKNTDLNLAVSRLYQNRRQPGQALQVSREALQRDPDNLDAQRGVVDAAISAGNLALANRVATEALQAAPDDPRSHLMAAAVAGARDDRRAEIAALRLARDLRRQQLQNTLRNNAPTSP